MFQWKLQHTLVELFFLLLNWLLLFCHWLMFPIFLVLSRLDITENLKKNFLFPEVQQGDTGWLDIKFKEITKADDAWTTFMLPAVQAAQKVHQNT